MKILYAGGQTAGLIGRLTCQALGHDVTQDSALSTQDFDLYVSVHSREIVSNEFLSRFKYGGINLHPCLYKYKGKDPIGRAKADRCVLYSVGAHRMTEIVDGGEVLVERFVSIPDAAELSVCEIYNKLYPLYFDVLGEALKLVCP